MAAAMGSSMSETLTAPAERAASMTAFFSTWVMPVGTQMTMEGLTSPRRPMALRMKETTMRLATSKSATTPSFMGRTVRMRPGVLPRARLASAPTARTSRVCASMATTEGSLTTMPPSLV